MWGEFEEWWRRVCGGVVERGVRWSGGEGRWGGVAGCGGVGGYLTHHNPRVLQDLVGGVPRGGPHTHHGLYQVAGKLTHMVPVWGGEA